MLSKTCYVKRFITRSGLTDLSLEIKEIFMLEELCLLWAVSFVLGHHPLLPAVRCWETGGTENVECCVPVPPFIPAHRVTSGDLHAPIDVLKQPIGLPPRNFSALPVAHWSCFLCTKCLISEP